MTGNNLCHLCSQSIKLYNWTQAKCPNLVLFQNKEQVHGDSF